PLRNDFGSQPRTRQSTRWWHRRATSHGLPRRILHGTLRQEGRRAYAGGAAMYPGKNRLTREEALRLYTQGSSWFSSESGKKGTIAVGQLADLAALTDDYFSVPEENIKGIESVLT